MNTLFLPSSLSPLQYIHSHHIGLDIVGLHLIVRLSHFLETTRLGPRPHHNIIVHRVRLEPMLLELLEDADAGVRVWYIRVCQH